MSVATAPSLSLCVPTHSGRADALDELLFRLGREPDAHRIEVCVSDNASRDATGDVIQRHRAAFGDRLIYQRQAQDLGMAENVLRCIELASTDYCWLMGSDDAPAPGALARVLGLIAEHDGVTGIALGHVRVNADDLDTPGYIVVPEPYPPQRTVTRFRSVREVAESIGYLIYFTSNQVVHRDRWRAAADPRRNEILAADSAPHLLVTGWMTARDPDWIWCPEPLVLSRERDVYLLDADVLGNRLAAAYRQMFVDLDYVWALLHGRRSYEYRAAMYKVLRHVWDAENVLGMRVNSPGAREYLANLACIRYFWWCRWFWLHCLPRLVLPVAPLRAGRRRSRWGASVPIDPQDSRIQVRAALPERMTVGYSARVMVRVRNGGSRPISSAGPYAVRIAARWRDPEVGQDVLALAGGASVWPPLRPGGARTLELTLVPPPRPGVYDVSIGPHQIHTGWLDEGPGAGRPAETVPVDPLVGN